MAFGLLDVVKNTLRVAVANNASEVRGCLATNTGAKDDGLSVLLGEQLQHLVEGEGAADVGIENEEPLGLALKDGITEVIQPTSSAEGLVFS